MKQLVGMIVLVIILFGCKKPKEAPIFRRVANVKITEVKGTEALLKGEAFFYNPNDVSMKLRKVDIDVMMEGKKIGSIKQSMKTKIPAMAEFKVPVDARVNLGDAGMLNGLLRVLGGKKMNVHYVGQIKLSIYGVPVSVRVDYEEQIRLRL